MQTFDTIYILDLHGSTNKKERAEDGGEDKNVFDIKTGVTIFIGIKKQSLKKIIFRADIHGTRPAKFTFLDESIIDNIAWKQITPTAPNYAWVESNSKLQREYEKGFSVNELFPVSSVGIVTSRDEFVIDTNREVLARRIQEFFHCETPQEALVKFGLRETLKWKAATALKHTFSEKNIVPISYRPFDTRYVYYSDDFIERPRREVMRHMFMSGNISLSLHKREELQGGWAHAFVTNNFELRN